MKNYFLIIGILFNSLILVSQEISIKIVEIKSLDTNAITNSSFSLKKIEAKGLTNKKKNNYFNYNLDFDILSKENIIDITKSTELVIPTWVIKQKFKEGGGNKSKFKADYYLGNLETQSEYISPRKLRTLFYQYHSEIRNQHSILKRIQIKYHY